MTMRSFLRTALITDIQQHEFERVVVLSLETNRGPLQLVLEVFGNGNLVLLSNGNKIIQALTYKRMRDRNILRGEAFAFAPSSGKNPREMTLDEFQPGLRAFGDVQVVRALTRFVGIGGVYSEETLLRAKVEKTTPCMDLSNDETRNIHSSLQLILSQVIEGTLEPLVVLDEKCSSVDVLPVRLVQYEREGYQLEHYDTFNEALDEFFTRILIAQEAAAGIDADGLRKEADRLNRVIADQTKLVAEDENRAGSEKQKGDAVYAHLAEFQILLENLLEAKRKGQNWKTLINIKKGDREALTQNVRLQAIGSNGLFATFIVDGLTFDLNLNRNLFKNASEFYEQAKKSKQKAVRAKDALKESLEKLDAVTVQLGKAEEIRRALPGKEELLTRKIEVKQWFEKFRWFLSSDRFLVVAGRDAVTNEVLIKKYTSNEDIVFHADIIGAPFVVIKTEKRNPSVQCLNEAAEFAASFSRGWREGFGSVDVYWVKPSQVTKTARSGESVGHGAFVIHGQRNWMRGMALQVAIGVKVNPDGSICFVGGPTASVKALTNTLVTIVPGDMSGKDLFKLILNALARKAPTGVAGRICRASIEELRDYVPFGKGNLSKD
jgi:predicted ribosome quality control (RQC) complex YloA/Tae2 family protein